LKKSVNAVESEGRTIVMRWTRAPWEVMSSPHEDDMEDMLDGWKEAVRRRRNVDFGT
jgi:hypothetical protein